MTKTVLALGGGLEGLPILEKIKALGYRLIVVDANPHAPGLALADDVVLASCYDAGATIEALVASGAQGLPRPDGVLCCAVDAPNVAANAAFAYRLPGIHLAGAALSANKVAQKTALRAAKLPVPDFRTAIPTTPWYPPKYGLVVKPVDSRGARGVEVVPGALGLEAAFERAKAASPTGRAMFESFIPGSQLSTESIVQDGRVLFTMIGERNYARWHAGEFGPHPIEDGFDAPAPSRRVSVDGESVSLSAAIDTLLARACRALGWDNLTVKGDWIVGENGRLYVLELAARLSGGFFGSHGAPLAYGVDLVGAAVRLALGERVERPAVTGGQFVCQRYIFPDAGDVGRRVVSVTAVTVLNSGRMGVLMGGTEWVYAPISGIQHATYALHPGDTIRAVTDHGARWGQVICTGATANEARARAEAAVREMKVGVVLE